MEKIKIEFEHYDYECGDGCCYEYGVITKVNGEELEFRNEDTETIVRGILEKLGFEVEIETKYNED